MNRSLSIIISGIITYLFAAGISYIVFAATSPHIIASIVPTPVKTAGGTLRFDTSLPKTESCPLNGAMYSSQQKQWWEKHRPLGVMIENQTQARPQSGLSFADVVYEAVAEGGITRFLSMFYCQDAPQVGPIRSARTHFIAFLSEYGDYPLYAHVGGANQDGPADALGQLADYGWVGYNDLNQFSIGFPTYWRDYNRLGHEVATEHTMYSTTTKLWDFAATNRDLTNVDKKGNKWDEDFVPYTFKEDAVVEKRGAKQSMHVEFWTSDPDYFVDWTYNSDTNTYQRNNGGKSHIDKDTNKQIAVKTLVMLSMVEENADDGYENNVHLLYDYTGTGKAKVFMDGKVINAVWKKADRTDRLQIIDTNGDPISFNKGLLWFEILPLDGVIKIK